jgi:3-deoxy-D-manno-octulosonic-acid transferase
MVYNTHAITRNICVLKYRLIMMLAWLAVPIVFVQRLITGKDNFQTFSARLGYTAENTANPRLLWLHAASLGEFNTLELLLPAIKQKFTNYDLLITVSNKITFEKAKLLRSAAIHIDIAPTDFSSVVNKFLNHWKPTCLITIENEVYPNRNIKCAQSGIPIVFVNARMSAKSFATWHKNSALSKEVFSCIDYCFAQDQNAFDRFANLGVPMDRMNMLGNLKQFQKATPVVHQDLRAIRKAFPKQYTLCAASTHKGEDQVILDAFKTAKATCPDLKLILVPRHANRAAEIIALIKKSGLSYTQRSQNELPSSSNDIYLADTIGEMPLWYSSAAVTFVAGSLVPVGGHTPYEPAAYGSAIIHGSQYSNFQAIYEQLVANKGSLQANTAQDISAAWLLLTGTQLQEAQVNTAKNILFKNSDKDKMIGQAILKIETLLGINTH